MTATSPEERCSLCPNSREAHSALNHPFTPAGGSGYGGG
jgi:hypothetical protein